MITGVTLEDTTINLNKPQLMEVATGDNIAHRHLHHLLPLHTMGTMMAEGGLVDPIMAMMMVAEADLEEGLEAEEEVEGEEAVSTILVVEAEEARGHLFRRRGNDGEEEEDAIPGDQEMIIVVVEIMVAEGTEFCPCQEFIR